jgi:hypothetical protein
MGYIMGILKLLGTNIVDLNNETLRVGTPQTFLFLKVFGLGFCGKRHGRLVSFSDSIHRIRHACART